MLRCEPVQFTIPVTSPNQVNADLIDSEVENLLTKGAIAEPLPPPPHKRRFLQSFVPSPQEGWNFLTCDRLEFSKQVCGKLSLPGGKHSLFEVSTSKRRLYDHSGSERRLFVSPSPQGPSKVPSIPLAKQMLRLPRPLSWLKYRTKDLHQTFKTRSSIPSQTGCSYDPLSGRLSNLGFNLPGGTESHSYGSIPPGKPRLHCQSGKPCLIPTQIITFLGFVINSTVEALSLPQEKVVKVTSLCLKAKVTRTMPARQIASVLGTLESCRPAIWQAPLHFRHLQIRMIQALHASNQNFDVIITLDHDSLEELHWWVSNINSVNGSPIRSPAPTLFITTDASMTGWRAVCESQRTNGRWSDSERAQHINVLELKAAFLALKSFLKNQSHKVVCLRMDNTTAVAHVNNKGGTHSPCLLALTLELWQWCLERNIMISAQHVPGKLNTIADLESRVFNNSSEWKIAPQIVSPFLKGCEIDLFASRLSAQLPQ